MTLYRRQVFICISFSESGIPLRGRRFDERGLWNREKLQEVFAQAVHTHLSGKSEGADVEVVMLTDEPLP